VEYRYKKKLNRAMETFLDRVEGQSSSAGSGSNSGDEKHVKGSKKRKFKEYLTGLK
jgi:hypothetical protein